MCKSPFLAQTRIHDDCGSRANFSCSGRSVCGSRRRHAPLNITLDVPYMSPIIRSKLGLIWAATVVLSAGHVILRSDADRIGTLNLISLVITAALLPFVAGFLFARAGKSTALGTSSAGASIAVATILGVGAAYAVIGAGWLAFAGFILATAMFGLVPSAVFGLIGGWVARKYEPRHV
jgi:hypothetical protein